ncbi:MAG TPA: FGGY family carbohydrate kinase [Solirubrobacteraceae bacterium]|nr:FGGY family carbohydrate kinase [Solirubrobacteraceae bacterium]
MSDDAPLVVGVDVGSQGTCAQALAPDGGLVASTYAAHELAYPRPGWSEQDPAEWTRALVQTLAEVRLAAAGRPIAAVSFGSQLDGLVATDRGGRALRPALIWSDRRAGAECERVAESVDVDGLRARTGCNLDPGHVAAKIAWLRAHEPDVDAEVATYLLPGSWVACQASGELAVDPSNASSTGLLDPRRMVWCEEACAAFDVDPARLAPVRPAHAVLGHIAPWLREATGLSATAQVVLGAGDEMAAVLGAGVVEPGEVCDVMGTAEPVCAVTDEPDGDPPPLVELHPHAAPDRWLLENPGWLSGGAYRWFRDELGGPEIARAAATGADVYELLNTLARGAPAGADGVSWVPALSGAMTPEWNARARAGWYGLTAAHGRAHMARALLEGNAMALRDVVEAIAASGLALSGLVCVGGGARGDLLLSIRAHVTGLPVCRPLDVETTARGAAMLAAAGAGLHPSVAAAAGAMAGPRAEPLQPEPELRAVYDELHARHLRLYAALRPLFELQ